MQFLNPIWLWGLTGLAIPIGIHLLSRKEGKVILIGSLRYLRETPTAQFRHIRLNEIVLLILRCLMLTLIVFLLAGVKVNLPDHQNKNWLVLEKGVEKSARMKSLIDTLQQQGFETHLLAPGIPLLEDTLDTTSVSNYWSTSQELNAKELDSIVVISYNYLKNFKGVRLSPFSNILWLTDEPSEEKFAAQSVRMDGDSIWIRNGVSSLGNTKYETLKTNISQTSDTALTIKKETVRIAIFYDEGFDYDYKIVSSSLQAIQSITPHLLSITSRLTTDWTNPTADWIIWLADDSLPLKEKRNSIVYKKCTIANLPLLASAETSFLCGNNKNSTWIITKRLHEEIALKENLTLNLASVILPKKQNIVDTHDKRIMPEEMAWSSVNQKGDKISKGNVSDSGNIYLITLLLLILMSERLLAFKRNQ